MFEDVFKLHITVLLAVKPGLCWRFLFNLAFSELGAKSILAQISARLRLAFVGASCSSFASAVPGPFAGLGFQRLGGLYLTFRRKATGKQSARRVCFGHASVGQSTKLTTFTQASFNKRLTALLLPSTETRGFQTA